MTETSQDFSIELRHVSKRFGSSVVVNDVSLRIPRGTTFGFIGLNGAGKSTTIRMIAGLLRPTAGEIQLAGEPIPERRAAVRTKVGYVPDRPNVYGWMTVDRAIQFASSFYPAWNTQRCEELIQLFKLDRKKQVKHLSKGQGAKLSLLLAMSFDPEILLLDEPTSGFDPLVKEEFLEGILNVTSEKKQTVFFSSHTLSDVQRLADSVGLLHEGRLLFHSPIDALLDTTKRLRAVLEDEQAPRQTPPDMVYEQISGREWAITVRNFKPDAVDFVRSRNRVSNVLVEDLTLHDIFKDYVRAREDIV